MVVTKKEMRGSYTCCYLTQRVYMATARQLERLDSVTRSPIYTHFQESLTGAASIRAYRQQDRFVVENQRRIDHNQMAYYSVMCANRYIHNMYIICSLLLSHVCQ